MLRKELTLSADGQGCFTERCSKSQGRFKWRWLITGLGHWKGGCCGRRVDLNERSLSRLRLRVPLLSWPLDLEKQTLTPMHRVYNKLYLASLAHWFWRVWWKENDSRAQTTTCWEQLQIDQGKIVGTMQISFCWHLLLQPVISWGSCGGDKLSKIAYSFSKKY